MSVIIYFKTTVLSRILDHTISSYGNGWKACLVCTNGGNFQWNSVLWRFWYDGLFLYFYFRRTI